MKALLYGETSLQSIDVIEDASTGKFVTTITFYHPPPSDEDDAASLEDVSGQGFALFLRALRQQDILWLATQRISDTDD